MKIIERPRMGGKTTLIVAAAVLSDSKSVCILVPNLAQGTLVMERLVQLGCKQVLTNCALKEDGSYIWLKIADSIGLSCDIYVDNIDQLSDVMLDRLIPFKERIKMVTKDLPRIHAGDMVRPILDHTHYVVDHVWSQKDRRNYGRCVATPTQKGEPVILETRSLLVVQDL